MADVIKTTFKVKRGTAARWEELNPILNPGEPGFEMDTFKLKIGNGSTPWKELPYVNDIDIATSVQPDWNQNDETAADYIKNRPFYTGDTVETVLVEQNTVSFAKHNGLYGVEFPSTFSATVGETYKVYWDGTVYECTCENFNNMPTIGNLSIAGVGSDTGEPFIMGVDDDGRITIVTADTSASHTFSISGIVQEVVKIDPKYICDMYYTADPVETVLVEESTVAFADSGEGFYAVEFPSTFSATVGETYKVYWDGTVYECTCENFNNMPTIGNLSIAGVGSDTGEPFAMMVINGEGINIATADTAASHTFSISGFVSEVVKIDEKYLPDTIKSDVETAQTTANTAKTTAENALSTANTAKTTAENALSAAENSKIDPISYNYCATLFSKQGEFIGWYDAMPNLDYNKTLGSFYRSPFETTPLKYEDIPFSEFICTIQLSQGGLPFGKYILFLTKSFNESLNGWNVYGVAIHELGYTFYVKSAMVDKSTGEGLFLDFLPQNYILINSSTLNSSKKFKITVDDDYNVSATNTSNSVSKTLATMEYVDNSVSNPLNITSATVDQIAKITAVDDTGRPTAWESVDMLTPFKPMGKSYLTFSSPNSFTLNVNDKTKHWDGTLEYFTSDKTWTVWNGTTTLSSVDNDGDNVLYLRGTGNTLITGSKSLYRWILTGSNIKCIGNIENLLDYATVESGNHPTMANYCYSSMFSDCTSLARAPELPATTLADNCYYCMFYDCTSLTQAPDLPATTLAQNCYRSIFYGCTSLTKAPALPATTLANYCYYQMFDNCTSLTQAPALPATTLAQSCYNHMFDNCTSLTQAPALPATTLADSCYWSMFRGCIFLTQAPALPATTLADNCYYSMFYGCTSLTQAPTLPATTLARSCYSHMFDHCTSLTQAPALPATTLAQSCYDGMFYSCRSLTQAPALPATTLADGCYSDMFRYCTSLKLSSTQTGEYTQEYRIPTTGTGTTATDALTDMFTSTGGTFKGTPAINTTYYLSTDNMIVRETEVVTLNGYVGSMIDAAIGKYADTAEYIIPSSTAGSTKKFKITVDDSGAITATEVT